MLVVPVRGKSDRVALVQINFKDSAAQRFYAIQYRPPISNQYANKPAYVRTICVKIPEDARKWDLSDQERALETAEELATGNLAIHFITETGTEVFYVGDQLPEQEEAKAQSSRKRKKAG